MTFLNCLFATFRNFMLMMYGSVMMLTLAVGLPAATIFFPLHDIFIVNAGIYFTPYAFLFILGKVWPAALGWIEDPRDPCGDKSGLIIAGVSLVGIGLMALLLIAHYLIGFWVHIVIFVKHVSMFGSILFYNLFFNLNASNSIRPPLLLAK